MRTTSLLLALTLSLASCGDADPSSLNSRGYDALGSGKHADAATQFHAALDAIGSDTSHDQYERAMLGLIEANVHEDAEAAEKDFLAFASSTNADSGEYLRIGGLLASAKRFTQAINVLHSGIEAHPEAPALLSRIEQIRADAEKTGDTEAVKHLEGLGYVE